MDLSIIVPVYNYEVYIERCIKSIMEQAFSYKIEVVLVNDGSNDNSGRICDDFKVLYANIKVVHQVNTGVSSARNSGLALATGKYVWFVDADDYIEPNSIDYLLKVVQEYDLDLLQFSFNLISSKNTISKYLSVCKSVALQFPEYMNANHFKGVLWQSFIKRSCIGGVKFHEKMKLGQDGLFFMSIFKNIKIAKRIDLKVYNYCQNDLSVTHNIPFEVCLRVSGETSMISIPEFARPYVDEFIAFYASLSIYSEGYNQLLLVDYLKIQPIHINDLFFSKVIQNAFAYNYGLLKEKKSRVLRVNTLKRIKLINSNLTKSVNLSTQVIRIAFKFVPAPVLDSLFYLGSLFIKFFVLKR